MHGTWEAVGLIKQDREDLRKGKTLKGCTGFFLLASVLSVGHGSLQGEIEMAVAVKKKGEKEEEEGKLRQKLMTLRRVIPQTCAEIDLDAGFLHHES